MLRAFLLLALVLLPASAMAQTGVIRGFVLEAATGDPLPGVNVRIDGTTQGAQSNLNGEFVIIGVRPGTYSVVASFVGFRTERRDGVSVNIDLTSTVEFRLREEVFEGEEVVVTADAVGVRRDVTSSESRVTSETIDRLPVQELSQVIGVQAGITQRGGFHIRGGRSSEVTYMVDGVPVTDSWDGSAAVQVENSGIQELQVISGTFNAEYGNAMSGIINVVTKEGRGDRFAGKVDVYSGSYLVTGSGGEDLIRGTNAEGLTTSGIQYRNVDRYSYLPVNPTQYYNAGLALEGPLGRANRNQRNTFFVLGRYFKNDGWIYGARLFNMDGTAGDSSLVAMNNFEKLSGQANLRFQLTDRVILNFIGLASTSMSRPGDFGRRWSPDGRQRNYDLGVDTKVKLTHLLSPTSFYTIDVSRFERRAWGQLFDSPTDSRYNSFNLSPPDSIELIPGSGVFTPVPTGGTRFLRGGTELGRYDRTTTTFLAKADFTSQIHRYHLVKAGVQLKFDQLSSEGYGLRDSDPSTPEFTPGLPDPNSLDYNFFDDARPMTFSAYIQDKMEYESFIMNLGIRFDYFDPRARVPSDPSDPNIRNPFKLINRYRDTNGNGVIEESEAVPGNELSQADREAYWYRDVKPKYQISPRLGVAYPITERGVIYFSYGHFLQIPTLNRLFDQYDLKIRPETGSYGVFGNPDLSSERTVMYELGLRQGFGPYTLEATTYYRDVRNWVSTSRIITTELPGVNYVIYANRDYANTRGLTLSFRRGFVDNWGFDFSYTFQVVEGSNSDPAAEFFAALGNAQPSITLLPLDWDQRHRVAGAFYTGGQNWGVSALGSFGTGFPYTPSSFGSPQRGQGVTQPFPTNSRRMPATYQLDLYAYREFQMGPIRPRLFLQVFNVFDTRNASAVFGDTGRPDVSLVEARTGEFDNGFYARPDFFAEPRRLHAGLEFNF